MFGNGCTQPRCKTSILGKGAFAIRAESAEAKILRVLRARRGLEKILWQPAREGMLRETMRRVVTLRT